MTENQKAAYIIAQSVSAYAEIESMKALNIYRDRQGETIAYDEKAFLDVIEKYGIHHNGVLGLFHG